MIFEKIVGMIERFRKLTSMSSLPFLLEDKGETFAIWFYYDVHQSGEREVEIQIEKICVFRNNRLFTSDGVNIIIRDILTAYEEPILSEGEYLTHLESIYRRYSRDDMFTLLSRAIIAPLLCAYEAAEVFCKDESNSLMTEVQW